MKTSTCFLSLGLLLSAPAAVHADMLSVAPSQTMVLPDDQTGTARVALLFDLSGLRAGEGRRVDEALIDWTISGVPSGSSSTYSLFPATAAWNGSSVSIAEDPVEVWDIEPLEVERNGGLVRFSLRDLASDWAEGGSNYGVVITTPDVTAQTLAAQMLDARLIVRYGFFR